MPTFPPGIPNVPLNVDPRGFAGSLVLPPSGASGFQAPGLDPQLFGLLQRRFAIQEALAQAEQDRIRTQIQIARQQAQQQSLAAREGLRQGRAQRAQAGRERLESRLKGRAPDRPSYGQAAEAILAGPRSYREAGDTARLASYLRFVGPENAAAGLRQSGALLSGQQGAIDPLALQRRMLDAAPSLSASSTAEDMIKAGILPPGGRFDPSVYQDVTRLRIPGAQSGGLVEALRQIGETDPGPVGTALIGVINPGLAATLGLQRTMLQAGQYAPLPAPPPAPSAPPPPTLPIPGPGPRPPAQDVFGIEGLSGRRSPEGVREFSLQGTPESDTEKEQREIGELEDLARRSRLEAESYMRLIRERPGRFADPELREAVMNQVARAKQEGKEFLSLAQERRKLLTASEAEAKKGEVVKEVARIETGARLQSGFAGQKQKATETAGVRLGRLRADLFELRQNLAKKTIGDEDFASLFTQRLEADLPLIAKRYRMSRQDVERLRAGIPEMIAKPALMAGLFSLIENAEVGKD